MIRHGVVLRVAAYLVVVIMGGVGLLTLRHQADTIEQLSQDRHDEDCVAAWDTHERIRVAIARGTAAGAEAHQKALLAAFAQFVTDQQRLGEFSVVYRQTLVDEFAVADPIIRSIITDPECDLDAARRRLG